MGSKFIRVTGRLQSASDVVHVVAEKMEDLSPWLAVLHESSGDPATEEENSRADRVITPRAGLPDSEIMAQKAREVMPKGRNFQ
jgi:error-prone DNA polymerase